MSARASASLAFLALIAWPSPLAAQRDAFVAAVQELAVALVTAEPERHASLAGAVDQLASSLGEWDRQIAAIEARSARTPAAQLPQLRVELARQYLERGRAAEAARELDAVAPTQAQAEIHVLRALALDTAGDTAAADAARRDAWAADPRHPLAAYYVLRRAERTAADDHDAARAALVAAYRDLIARPARPGQAPFPTVGVIRDSLARVPIVADAVTARGVALLIAHRYSDAVSALRADLHRAASPERGDAVANMDGSPLAQFARGRNHEEAHRIGEARRAFEAAGAGTLVGRSPLYAGVGRLAQIEGDFDAATESFERAVHISPNDPGMRKVLAQAYAVQERTDEAVAELVAALLIDSRDAHAHAALGQMFLDAGRDEDAVSALTRAIALAPEAFETRYALAAALTRVGRTTDAAREMETFERARRDMVERQRRQIAGDVRNEEALRERLRQSETR